MDSAPGPTNTQVNRLIKVQMVLGSNKPNKTAQPKVAHNKLFISFRLWARFTGEGFRIFLKL